MKTQTSRSAEIRARLDHPVIDADGHMIEFEAGILDYLERAGGRRLVERFNSWGTANLFNWSRLTPEERRDRRATRVTMLDEWAACEIERAEDIRELFVPNFYFGCESDDAITSWAFNTRVNPFGARLRVLFSSDIGHWGRAGHEGSYRRSL